MKRMGPSVKYRQLSGAARQRPLHDHLTNTLHAGRWVASVIQVAMLTFRFSSCPYTLVIPVDQSIGLRAGSLITHSPVYRMAFLKIRSSIVGNTALSTSRSGQDR